MGIFDRFPYSSTHEMNLDFMLGKATEIAEDMQQVTAGMEQVQAGLTAISEKTEQATQAAAQAAASASSIEGSVTAAEEAAEEAQMHNESAQTWANNAMTYKADCQRSATEAAASSSSAAQAATAAAASEDTVATYAQAANASAQSAANNNDSAHQYANQASASASNATFHSSNAQTAATNAQTAATNANTSATNASASADRAASLKTDVETLHRMCVAAVDQAATEAVNAANSAAQAAATKTDVETLVESLPEDFTDLNNTVNQLSDEIAAVNKRIIDLHGTITIDKTGYIIPISSEERAILISVSSDSALTFTGENIFDQSTFKSKTIKNDSGVETADNSGYFTQYIPCHGKTITSNFVMQRLYLYDANKNFLRRLVASGTRTTETIPDDTFFVQVQVESTVAQGSLAISYGTETPSYIAYQNETSIDAISGAVNVFTDGAAEFSLAITLIASGESYVIPAVGQYPMWEPETVTNEYSCTPLGQSTQSIPALTALGWNGFLETYFDIYLGTNNDGYHVYREDYGLDSGAQATGNIASPVYSYVFEPVHYNKTVLLSAGMNTCEASTYFGIAYFIKALMEHTEPGMLALYNTTRFIVMPVICPSGIAHDPLLYFNSNGVSINKNFEYYGSWQRLKNENGGTYPDSEIETKILKHWLNKYRDATFWLDCHSDTAEGSTYTKHLGSIFCSDSGTSSKLTASKQTVIDYYQNKGYFSAQDDVYLGFYAHDKSTAIYPKTQYAFFVTNTPSAIMEQFERSTAYGSNGATNNDTYAIKHYVAMIRYMVLVMCKSDAEIITE